MLDFLLKTVQRTEVVGILKIKWGKLFGLSKACGKTMNYLNLVFPEHEVDDSLMHLLKQVQVFVLMSQ